MSSFSVFTLTCILKKLERKQISSSYSHLSLPCILPSWWPASFSAASHYPEEHHVTFLQVSFTQAQTVAILFREGISTAQVLFCLFSDTVSPCSASLPTWDLPARLPRLSSNLRHTVCSGCLSQPPLSHGTPLWAAAEVAPPWLNTVGSSQSRLICQNQCVHRPSLGHTCSVGLDSDRRYPGGWTILSEAIIWGPWRGGQSMIRCLSRDSSKVSNSPNCHRGLGELGSSL